MSMELVLPPREQAERDETFASARRVQSWLQEVEQAGGRETTRRFIEGLRRFNRIELRLGPRLKIAETLRPMTRHVIDRLTQRISTRKLPLDDASQGNFRDLLTLLRERGLGYDIVVSELSAQSRPSRRKLALAAERALYYRGEVMLRSAPIHSPLPQNFWHDSNTLYRSAELHGCAGRQVRNDELIADKRRHSVADMYKRLLLFALAPTDGLRRGQAERLFQRTESWCRATEITDTPPRELTNTLYRVDLSRPEGPAPAGSDADASDELRWVEFGHVLAEAREALPGAPSEDAVLQPGQLDYGTLRRLIDHWSVHSGRASERVERGNVADVEISLVDIQARLKAETDPPESKPSSLPERPLGSVSALALQTVEAADHPWGSESQANEPERDADSPAGRKRAGSTSASGPKRDSSWILVEAGGGGFRLRWASGSSSSAVVGDLVGLREEGSKDDGGDTQWTVGTIRRIRMGEQGHFDAGVQILGRNPLAATVRREPANPHRKRNREAEPVEPALMLPADHERKTPATVLVPANTFEGGEVVELDLPGRMVRARLAPARDSSATFARFRLEKPPERGRHARDLPGPDRT